MSAGPTLSPSIEWLAAARSDLDSEHECAHRVALNRARGQSPSPDSRV
jgi:hypothetical protein